MAGQAPSRSEWLREVLSRRFKPALLEVFDDSEDHVGHAEAGYGGHYRVRMVADEFDGLSLLERHRLVYEAVGNLAGNGIHALGIDAMGTKERHKRANANTN